MYRTSPTGSRVRLMNSYKRIHDLLLEVAPPYWGHTKADKPKGAKVGGTIEAMKRAKARGDIPSKFNIFALAWSMKNKGDKPHYKPGKVNVLKKKYKPKS